MNDFYVYMYSGPNGVPFYVGKGRGLRYYPSTHLKGKQPFLKNKILKTGKENIVIKFLHTNLTEEQAFYLEEYYIAGIGRRDKGLGPLCNLTNGGEGPSGCVRSEEFKQNVSKVMTGNQYPLGYRHTEVTKKKISKAGKGRNVGKIRSEETRRKLSETHLGKGHTAATRKKMSITRKGRPLSEVHKQKIKDSWKKRREVSDH